MSKVGVISLGLGNIFSVLRMLNWIEVSAAFVDTPSDLKSFSHLILPGVGHFTEGTHRLTLEWRESIAEQVQHGTPLLGICLGMQLLCSQSEEGSGTGLNLLPCHFRLIPHQPGLRIPHMGWNEIIAKQSSRLLQDISEPRFYFVHSFYAAGEEKTCTSIAQYGVDIAAILECDNCFGVQFHPEKSHSFGMRLLKNFSSIN